jgi:succinate-acetate transporter protein
MAVGNTFGATALSSYGGFWLSFAIILTPGGFDIVEELGGATGTEFHSAFGLYLMVSLTMLQSVLHPALPLLFATLLTSAF